MFDNGRRKQAPQMRGKPTPEIAPLDD